MMMHDWRKIALDLTGYYEIKTTLGNDFDIADAYGESAIKDTYARVISSWGDNVMYLAELVLILNWKIWQHYENGNYNLMGGI